MIELRSLPWRIKKDIIELLILDSPYLISLNKEWFKQVVKRHGKLVVTDEMPFDRPVSLLAPYIEKAYFGRMSNINWIMIGHYKNLKHVELELCFKNAKEYEEMNENLLLLPPLESFHVRIAGKTIDVSNVLAINVDNLKYLSLPALCFESKTSELVFPYLNSLRLHSSCKFMVLQSIVKNMPSLSSLHVVAQVKLNKTPLTEIRELTLYGSKRLVKLDLQLFPKLLKLNTHDIELVNPKTHINIIERLFVKGPSGFNSLSKITFQNLKNLAIYITGVYKHKILLDIFLNLTTMRNLAALKLEVDQTMNFSVQVPCGPYSFSKLTLVGPFIVNSYTLARLSEYINPNHLEFHGCSFNELCGGKASAAPFKALRYVAIYAHEFQVDKFMRYFNYDNHPDVVSIKLQLIK